MIHVAHIITSLNVGGAENMLRRLIAGLDQKRFRITVISLTDVGPVGEALRSAGTPVRALGMTLPSRAHPSDLLRLAGWLRELRPNIVQTWLYHADFLGGLAARLAGVDQIAWNLRRSYLEAEGTKRSRLLITRACARLSGWLPKRIVCCAEAARRAHIAFGYCSDSMRVIPNGFDLEIFRPDEGARSRLRSELGLPEKTLLVGLVGRFEPLKDHRNFIAAAALVATQFPDVHFVLCGDKITDQNQALAGWIAASGVPRNFHLLGRRTDIPQVTAALDVATLSSISEGFPNVVGEAMACGVPCVVTDVGEAAKIVGPTGKLVPPRNPEALARALCQTLELSPEERKQRGREARQRIEDHFNLSVAVEHYSRLYEEMVSTCVESPVS